MIAARLPVYLAAFALVACSQEPAPTHGPSTPAVVPTSLAPAAPGPVTPASPVGGTSAAAVPLVIPAGMRGRFGLVPDDCTTTRGDDKGLVTVGPDSLKFYESIARLIEASEGTANHVKGRFAYSGEGMEWQREARLDLADGGKTLILEEFGEDAVPGPRAFRRCPG